MDLSVIIPTCNRPWTLARCLAGLDRQSLSPQRFEVLVCDDGSTFGVESVAMAAAPGLRLRLFRQQRSGPAAARNQGIRAAAGELLLFLNDDAIPDSELLLRHVLTHEANAKVAVLGRLTTAARHLNTRFAWILERTNALFGYNGLENYHRYDYNQFYTCNVSVAAAAVRAAGGFDPDFADAAAEDIELGYRLQKQGLRVLYTPDCLTWHEHKIAPADFCAINYRRGYWAMLFFLKHEDLEKVPFFSEKKVFEWRDRLASEQEPVCQGLARLTASYLADQVAGQVKSDRLDAELTGLVELLHQHHYLRGLLASPYLALVIERQHQNGNKQRRSFDYDQEQRRSLL